MLRTLLAAGLAAAALPSGAASATSLHPTCSARADMPMIVDAAVIATGAFGCVSPRPGMSVTVCVELLAPVESPVWTPDNCSTNTAIGSVLAVEDTVHACVQRQAPVLVRTAVKGWNEWGNSATATSTPTWAPGYGSCGP